MGFISGGTGGSLKIQVGNVKYIYIIKYSLNFEMVEWAPPSLQECTGVRGGGGGGGEVVSHHVGRGRCGSSNRYCSGSSIPRIYAVCRSPKRLLRSRQQL